MKSRHCLFVPMLVTMLASNAIHATAENASSTATFEDVVNRKIDDLQKVQELVVPKLKQLYAALETDDATKIPEIVSLANAIISDDTTLANGATQIASAFASASKISPSPVGKKYCSLKSQAWQKRRQQFLAEQDQMRAIIELTQTKDAKKAGAKFTTAKKLIEKLGKEWMALNNEAEELLKDTPAPTKK